MQQEHGDDFCIEQCDKLIEEVDFVIEKLEHDEINRPMRLMGITASFSLIQTIVTTFFTIVLAVA